MEVKDNIIVGANELFRKYGIKSISMDDIARHLSISKKTIYQNFEDKDELVLAVVEFELQNDIERLNNISQCSKDIIDELVKTAIYMREHVSSLNPSLLFDLKKYHPKGFLKFREFSKNFVVEIITKCINRGIAEGLFRKDLDVEMMAIFRTESVELCFNPEIFPPEKFNFDKLHHQMFLHFLIGISTEKGHELLQKIKNI